jgi:putative sterol carrier protein
MAIPFPGDAWIKALMAELNVSAAYEDAARSWEGDFCFIVEPGGTLEKTVTLYMDLWHGKCRQAYEINEATDGHKPAFTLSAPVATWKRVLNKQLDPVQGMMTGKLHIKGNMGMIMKNVRAAKELVENCTHIPTEFPV